MKDNFNRLFIICFMLLFISCGDKQGKETVSTNDTPSYRHNNDYKAAQQKNDNMYEGSKLDEDAQFAVRAASGLLMKVEVGNLAVKNGGSDMVKQLGREMVKEYGDANAELSKIALSKTIALPQTSANGQQNMISELAGKRGKAFDKKFAGFMLTEFKTSIDLFDKEMKHGADSTLVLFAGRRLLTMQQHLEGIEILDAALMR